MFILQLSAIIKAKTAQLEKEAWGNFAASLPGSRTYHLWEFLEDLFGEVSAVEEEEGPPSKKSQPEDEPSTSAFGSSAPTLTDTLLASLKFFPMNDGSLLDSGITQEYLPV